MAAEELVHAAQPRVRIDAARLVQVQVAHVGRNPFSDIAQAAGHRALEVVRQPLRRPQTLHIPRMVQLMGSDGNQFFMAFLSGDPFGRPHHNHRRIRMFHAVAHVEVGKEVQKMVGRLGEGPAEVADHASREAAVVVEEAVVLPGRRPVRPNVKRSPRLLVRPMPKLRRRQQRRIRKPVEVRGDEGAVRATRQARRHIPRGGHIGQRERIPEPGALRVEQDAVHRIDVEKVVGKAGGAGVEDAGVEAPAEAAKTGSNRPAVEGRLREPVPGAVVGKGFQGEEVLGEVAELVPPGSPAREREFPGAVPGRECCVGMEFGATGAASPPEFEGDHVSRTGLQ